MELGVNGLLSSVDCVVCESLPTILTLLVYSCCFRLSLAHSHQPFVLPDTYYMYALGTGRVPLRTADTRYETWRRRR